MRSKWLNILVIVFTTILWAIQMIPEYHDGEFFAWRYVREYKFWVAIVSFGIVVLYHIFDIIVEHDKIQKRWIKDFLHHIVELDLGGNNYHTRVSVLKVKKGYSLIIRQIWYLLIVRFI